LLRIDPGVYAGLTDEVRAEVDRELAAYAALVDRNPLQALNLERYPKQLAYLANRSFIKGFIGGNGTGKSTVGAIDDIVQCCDEAAVPAKLREFKRWEPPVFLRVAAPDDGVLDSTVLLKFRELCPRDQLLGGSFDKAYDKAHRRLRFKNGSWILFNTFKQDRDSWAGVEVRRTRFDEEPPGEHGYGLYTESVARLRKWMPDAQVCFTMTPLLGLTWVADILDRGDAWRVTAGIRDNPFLPDPEAVIASLSHLSEAEKRAIIDGEFVHFAGAVVSLADEHVVPAVSADYLRDKSVYVGIDPGIRRGGVVWIAFDRDNGMLVFDELYPENLTVPRIAARIMVRNALWGLAPARDRDRAGRYFREMLRREELSGDEFESVMGVLRAPRLGAGGVVYIMDPAGGHRSLTGAGSVEDQFLHAGIAALRGDNDRRAGIMQLRSRLESGGLLVCENCVKLRWEAKRWLVASDEVIAEQRAKVKGAEGSFATIGPDHLWDPTRYVAQERLWYRVPGAVERARRWSPASGTAPPLGVVLGRRVPDPGPIGAY
jgi:phage terminase large subunit-like protein